MLVALNDLPLCLKLNKAFFFSQERQPAILLFLLYEEVAIKLKDKLRKHEGGTYNSFFIWKVIICPKNANRETIINYCAEYSFNLDDAIAQTSECKDFDVFIVYKIGAKYMLQDARDFRKHIEKK